MPSTMKGPAIFLAQFAGDAAPFNSLPSIAKWAAGLGYKGIQIPSWDARLFDLDKAAGSKTYCDEVKGICKDAGVEITELSTHLQGQLVAVHPAYDTSFDAFAPAQVPQQSEGAAEMGGRAGQERRQGLEASRPDGLGLVHRRACLPLSLSVAAAPGRPDRRGVRRARPPLEADPRRL